MKYEQLEERLDEDLAWRKKEISTLIFIAKGSNEEVILKSIILLLYSHWEGYVKKSSKFYIKFICEKKIKINSLCVNFKAVALKNNITRCIESKDSLTLANELNFIDCYLTLEEKNFSIKIDPDSDFDNSIVNTESNLKPKVFKNILGVLGLKYKTALQTREHYINSHLLANRNLIGHGSKFENSSQKDFSLSIADIEKLKDIVFSIIDNFREELLQYIKSEYYLMANEVERLTFELEQEKYLEKMFKQIEEFHQP
jgi:hypothetical protein